MVEKLVKIPEEEKSLDISLYSIDFDKDTYQVALEISQSNPVLDSIQEQQPEKPKIFFPEKLKADQPIKVSPKREERILYNGPIQSVNYQFQPWAPSRSFNSLEYRLDTYSVCQRERNSPFDYYRRH